jgi:hypothetical protein
MNFATALLNVRDVAQVERRRLNAGAPNATAREPAGRTAAQQAVRSGWTVRAAVLGSGVDLNYAARFHAETWRGAIAILSP